jgi:Ca-activated chloride channel family protein
MRGVRVMSQGMVRPAWLVAVVIALAVPARAASMLPSRMGMYTPQGMPLAILDSKVVVRMRGPVAEAVVTQTFRNDTDRVTEATYIFPLPVDAAVTAMEIETGSRTIRAAIEARERALQRYEAAVAAGVGAALLDQERPDVFTQTVSAIPAKGTIVVTLRFDTVATFRGGRWELALPLVVAPRYVPGTASGRPTTGTGRAPDTDRAPDASRVTPGGAPGAGGATDIVLELGDAVDDVTSPTHELARTKAGWTIHDPKSDHDAIVRWRAKVPQAGWVEAGDDGGYAAVVVEAPPGAAKHAALRMMLVLDRAATTQGDADAVKRPFVRALLAALDRKDQVAAVGTDALDWRAPEQLAKDLDASWGKPGGALDLTRTLGQARSDGAPLVLVTDGLVADDRAVLASAKKLGVPIHVIGIGPAPNRGLLTAIAATTGGTVRFLLVGDDLPALARDVIADAATQPQPLSITWGTLAASEVVPATQPRLGAGQASLVLAKVKRVQAANARVRGDVFGFVTVTQPRVPDGATTTRGALARRWAKLKLDELVVTGNAQRITEHAMRFGLVSPYTSMVAVGDEVVVQGGVKHSVPITVSVPEGMRWQLVKRELTFDSRVDDRKTGKKTEKTKNVPPAADKRPAQPRPEATPSPAPVTTIEPTAPLRDSAGADEEEDSYGERQTVSGAGSVAAAPESADYDVAETLSISGETRGRRLRLSLSLGGGLAVKNAEVAPLGGLALRGDIGGRTRYGLEGSLWLVDGLHAEGSVLGTASFRGIARRFELGTGAGLRLTGDGVGPALNLTLRALLPLRGLATYLRYDGALLLREGTYDGQNAGSLGLEATF